MPLTAEQLEKIQNQATARKERSNRLSNKNLLPIVYVPEGTLHVRFYTDLSGDYVKTFYRHKTRASHPTKLAFQCLGPDKCHACKKLNEFTGWTNGWPYASKEVAITYANILHYDGSSEYVKLETPVILMGNYKLANALSELIADLGSAEEIQKFFDPDELYAKVKIKSGNKGKDFSVSLLPTQPAKIPPLPEGLPPLAECIYKDEEEPPRDVIAKFVALMEEEFETWKMIKDAEEGSSDSPPPGKKEASPKKEKESSPPPAEEDESYSYPSDSEEDDDQSKMVPPTGGDASKQPSNCPAGFGQKPSKFLPQCLACTVDEECAQATQAAKAS